MTREKVQENNMPQQVQQPWPFQQPSQGVSQQPFTYQAQGNTRQPGITQQPSTGDTDKSSLCVCDSSNHKSKL